MNKIVCAYCGTLNDSSAETCIACGADLPISTASDRSSVEPIADAVPIPTPPPPPTSPEPELQQFQKLGESTDQLYKTGLQVYATLWRTLGEAVSIAFGSFCLGLIGGATGKGFGAVLLALALGAVVGLTIKNYLWVALSAPLGTLVGAAIWAIPWALGAGPGGMVFSAGFGAILLALLGGRQEPFNQKNIWEKLRPLFGTLGALAFVIFGLAVGWAVSGAVAALR